MWVTTFTYRMLALTGRVLLQLPQNFTKCAVDSNDFFPDNTTLTRRYSLRRK